MARSPLVWDTGQRHHSTQKVPKLSVLSSVSIRAPRALLCGMIRSNVTRFPSSLEITTDAVRTQIAAMGAEVFEFGLFKPESDEPDGGPPMLPRVWDVSGLMRSIPWLRLQNSQGRNIYVRPQGEHNLSLVDDLNRDAVEQMKRAGFQPATVIETSPGNYQAWLKHPERLPKDLGTAAARTLARQFGGDMGAADWRHFGRLGGFTNRKPKYQGPDGLFPFVLVIEATGSTYPEAERFLSGVRREVDEATRLKGERSRTVFSARRVDSPLKSIDAFRNNPTYGGDGTRVDLAYALYALSNGVSEADLRAALASRDLSHKGNERRQQEYIERTIQKAGLLLEKQCSRGLGR